MLRHATDGVLQKRLDRLDSAVLCHALSLIAQCQRAFAIPHGEPVREAVRIGVSDQLNLDQGIDGGVFPGRHVRPGGGQEHKADPFRLVGHVTDDHVSANVVF
jgi:hypothetical protein